MTTIRLPHTDLTIRRAETPSGKGNRKTSLVSFTTLNHTSKSGKVPTSAVGNTRLNWVGYVLDTLD